MTTVRRRKRPRPVRRRRKGRNRTGFWHGFRHATHTDHLRARVGGAAGRALVRKINKGRARRGKPPIPQRGGDWFTLPGQVKPFRPARPTSTGRVSGVRLPARPPAQGRPGPKPTVAGRVKARAGRIVKGPQAVQNKDQAAAAGASPVFSGPYVTASSGTVAGRKVKRGSISVTSSGIAGPGNRGAGAGIGVPAYGGGGEAGDDGHMISPGSAGGSATGGAPVGPGGLYGPNGGERTGTGWPTPPQTNRPDPDRSTTSTTTEGSSMSNPTVGGADATALIETPETDAEYVAALRGLAVQIRSLADSVQEVQASLLESVGMDQAALGAYDAIAEGLGSAAEACNQAVTDFLSVYAGVIETAQSGVKIPGGQGRFFTGDVS